MKKNRLYCAAGLLLALFFLLNFAGELFFSFGRNKIPERGLAKLQLAMKLFPLPSTYAAEAGFALLEKGIRDNDATTVQASI
ncbi:MAG: hypothetical protein JXO51_06865, partial [Candidatus Aminicenantes bacterium]|nr:hypothetical protein [Candidatus Aminicenantes bacterium]